MIREARAEEAEALAALYRAVFPEEDLVPLVRALLAEPAAVNFVAAEDAILGHGALTLGQVGAVPVALLGPLGVVATRRREGIGGRLIAAGTARMAARGAAALLVLGDPGYYSRLGFRPTAAVRPPYPLPEAWAPAWQALPLGQPVPEGTLALPGPWADPALWVA